MVRTVTGLSRFLTPTARVLVGLWYSLSLFVVLGVYQHDPTLWRESAVALGYQGLAVIFVFLTASGRVTLYSRGLWVSTLSLSAVVAASLSLLFDHAHAEEGSAKEVLIAHDLFPTLQLGVLLSVLILVPWSLRRSTLAHRAERLRARLSRASEESEVIPVKESQP